MKTILPGWFAGVMLHRRANRRPPKENVRLLGPLNSVLFGSKIKVLVSFYFSNFFN